MDASVASRIVAESCDIWSVRDQYPLMRMLQSQSEASGMDVEEYAKFMIDCWKEYKTAIKQQKLEYSYTTAAKFFQSAYWYQPDLWPWRKQQAGVQKEAVKELTSEEKRQIDTWRAKNNMAPLYCH